MHHDGVKKWGGGGARLEPSYCDVVVVVVGAENPPRKNWRDIHIRKSGLKDKESVKKQGMRCESAASGGNKRNRQRSSLGFA